MRRRLKPAAIGLGCLACCLPFLIPALGITAGTAGAVGAWLAGNGVPVVAGVGLVYVAVIGLTRRRLTTAGNKHASERKETQP